jgi:hypothetical protein
VEKAASGLSSANVTVLNGSEGLSNVVAGLVSQGLTIFDTVRGNLQTADSDQGAESRDQGMVVAPPPPPAGARKA